MDSKNKKISKILDKYKSSFSSTDLLSLESLLSNDSVVNENYLLFTDGACEFDNEYKPINAGIGGVPGFFEVKTEDWQDIWDVNVMGHIHAAKHVLPQMIKRGSGYLVNTASAAGLLTQIGSAPYSVTKAGALSLAEWLKITYGEKGIGVSCLCPQAVETPMTAQGAGTAGVDGMISADECAADVIDAIKKDRFLVTPHKEVLEYIQRKSSDYDRWISGMQRLQKKFEDFYNKFNSS